MTRRGLKYHLDTSHGNNLKKTPCPLCNVKFFRLKEHTKRHGPVEEYTFLCPHCPFKFNREKWLKKHLVKDHGETVVWKPRYVKKTVRKKYKKREKYAILYNNMQFYTIICNFIQYVWELCDDYIFASVFF